MTEELNEFVCGGYFLTRMLDRPDFMSPDLLPARIFSASSCISDIVPDAWAVAWATYTDVERQEEAIKYGITQEQLPLVIEWVTEHLDSHEIGWPDTFFSIGLAREFASQFLPTGHEVVLIGIGLHISLVEYFLMEEKPARNQGTPGVYESISGGSPLEAGGEILGFEILGYEYGGFHSWLCNGLEVDTWQELGIRPNSSGFIANLEDARRASEYISREEVGAEPALWQPWIIAKYEMNV